MSVTGQCMRIRGGRAATVLAALVLLAFGWGAAVSRADSTSVFFDAGANVGAGPSPFNGTYTGSDNVGVGIAPMQSLTDGAYNIGIGTRPLPAVTSGRYNIGIGTFSLDNLTTGYYNTALGASAVL